MKGLKIIVHKLGGLIAEEYNLEQPVVIPAPLEKLCAEDTLLEFYDLKDEECKLKGVFTGGSAGRVQEACKLFNEIHLEYSVIFDSYTYKQLSNN